MINVFNIKLLKKLFSIVTGKNTFLFEKVEIICIYLIPIVCMRDVMEILFYFIFEIKKIGNESPTTLFFGVVMPYKKF